MQDFLEKAAQGGGKCLGKAIERLERRHGSDKSGALAPRVIPRLGIRTQELRVGGEVDREGVETGPLLPLATPVAVPDSDPDAVISLPIHPDLGIGQRPGRAVIVIEPKRDFIDRRERGNVPQVLQRERRIHEKADGVGLFDQQIDAHLLLRALATGRVGQEDDIDVAPGGDRPGTQAPREERFGALLTFEKKDRGGLFKVGWG